MTLIKIAGSDAEIARLKADHSAQRAIQQEKTLRFAAQAETRSTVNTAGATHLYDVPWSNVPHYGWDHARNTRDLAVHIMQSLEHTPREMSVLKAAALFHDLARATPWTEPDPQHGLRSAELVDLHLRADPEYRGDEALRDQVCRIVAAHALDTVDGDGRIVKALELPRDPVLRALWDAECLEACRFAPGTLECGRLLKARMSRLTTDWARLPEHQRRWRKHRGWT